MKRDFTQPIIIVLLSVVFALHVIYVQRQLDYIKEIQDVSLEVDIALGQGVNHCLRYVEQAKWSASDMNEPTTWVGHSFPKRLIQFEYTK